MKVFREFVLGMSITSSGSREERLRWSFRLYDISKDGVLRVEEMVKIVASIFSLFGECEVVNIASAEDTANEIFTKMDVNKDGTVSEEEFINCCLQDKTISELLTNKKYK